jgi:hypothetical protein
MANHWSIRIPGYAPLAPTYESCPLPYRPKPREDELFSSWLCHIAGGYGIKIQTFCNAMWPGTPIWNRDVDKSVSRELLTSVALMTATAISRAEQTLLRSLEGKLFPRYIPKGNTKWILPLGIYHRIRRRPGLQYCPQCLLEDNAFLRRTWRLSLTTVCEFHNCSMRDRCPFCKQPLHFHRGEMGKRSQQHGLPATQCTFCEKNLTCELQEPEISLRVQEKQAFNLMLLRSEKPHLDYFEVLAQLVRLLSTPRPRLENFRLKVALEAGVPLTERDPNGDSMTSLFDSMNVQNRRNLLEMAGWLMEEWPLHLHYCGASTAVRASDFLRDFPTAPSWYTSATEAFADPRRRRRP